MRRFSQYLLAGLALALLVAGMTLISRALMLTPAISPPPSLPAATPPIPTLPSTLTPTLSPTVEFGMPEPIPTSTPTPPPPNPPLHATPPFTVPAGDIPPTPVPQVEQPEGTVNILLLGADQESSRARGRTDVLIVVSINPDIPAASMLSIPRDFYAWIPTVGYGKINIADSHGQNYPGGGPALLKTTIEYNLGIPIDYYARVDFRGFVQVVDTLGGVDVPVECELHDTFPDPANPPSGTLDLDLYPGIQHLDGQQALWYVRSRWSTHDFDRNRRQQQVLRALYRQVRNLDVIPRIPELWGAIQGTVETDLGLQDLVWLGWVASRLDMSNVKSRFILPPYVQSVNTPETGYVLLPVEGALEPLIAEALQPPATGRANQPPFRIEVLDGMGGNPGLVQVAVERLRWEGFEVVSVGTAEQVYPRTQIIDLTTTDKGSPLWLLQRLYRREAGDIFDQPTPDSPADLRIILGSDYNPCVSQSAIQYVPAPTPTPTPAP